MIVGDSHPALHTSQGDQENFVFSLTQNGSWAPESCKGYKDQRRLAVPVAPFTTVMVSADGYCFEWCTLFRAVTPFDSS